jgi:hypothetical protein
MMSLHCSSISVAVALPIDAVAALHATRPLSKQLQTNAILIGFNFGEKFLKSANLCFFIKTH